MGKFSGTIEASNNSGSGTNNLLLKGFGGFQDHLHSIRNLNTLEGNHLKVVAYVRFSLR
jgi:hypothetical protein